MLTIATIKNSTGAAKYFLHEDNYYLSEVDAKEASEWWGGGAAKLNLKNKILEKTLVEVFTGKLPNGLTVGLQKDGTIKHRPGFDLCFQAPKSVSILALVGEDKSLYDAHLEAVKETLKEIEKDCAEAKVFKEGKVSFEKTKNLAVALIKHTTSRELDPHLHHHALVINATERADKNWRALASSMVKTPTKYGTQVNGFFEKIYNRQIYYGMLYKHALANKVVSMGYEIENVGANGLWEIKGVPKEARELMSKRRKKIEEQLESLNYRSMKATDMVSLGTREQKPDNIKFDEIRKYWEDELAKKADFSASGFIAKHRERGNIEKIEKIATNESAKESVKSAIEHLSRYTLKLDYTKLISQALEFSIGRATHEEVVSSVKQLIKDGELLSLDKTDSVFITKDLIAMEKNIMGFVARDKDAVFSDDISKTTPALNSSVAIKGAAFDSAISKETRDCAINVLRAKTRLSLIENSNSNNLDLMAAILNLAETSGKTVRVLSINRLMANNINENIKRKPNSLWQWLISLGKPEIGECVAGFKHRYQKELNLPSFLLRFKQGKEVIIVDGAEMLGSGDTYSLLELTEKSKAKLIFLRDLTTKFSSVAGNPLETLKQAGIEVFEVGKEQGKGDTKQNLSFDGTVKLKAVKDDYVRIRELAKEYAEHVASKSQDNHEKLLVLVGSKSRLIKTNEIIREELKNRELLSGVEQSISVLTPVFMSRPEAVTANSYQKNMIIRIYRDRLLPEDWRARGYNCGTNTLRLVHNKKRMLWSPKVAEKNGFSWSIFRQDKIRITKGDRLVATSTIRDLGIKNATRFTVTNIDDKWIELLSGSGAGSNKSKTIKIKLDRLQNSHLQYDYATTLNRSLKTPVTNVLADFKSYTLDKNTISELARRTKNSLTIFTDDIVLAKKRFSHLPIKLNAVDTLFKASEINTSSKSPIEIKGAIEKAITILKEQYEFRSQPERRALEFALEKITSRNAGFSYEELITEALKYALKNQMASGNTPVIRETVEKIFAEKHLSQELATAEQSDGIWTTREALEVERTIIGEVKKGVNKLTPLVNQSNLDLIKNSIEHSNLTRGQKDALLLITTTKDQYVVIQGYAGTGKTTVFSYLQDLLKEASDLEKKEIIALAPTHRAVRELKDRGLNAQTLKSFLAEQEKQIGDQQDPALPDKVARSLDNKLIILDEASMVSNKDLADFIGLGGKSEAHVVLGGDRAQHLSMESGKSFEVIQKSNILKIALLTEIIRQKNPLLKEAVKETIKHNYQQALDNIGRLNPQDYIARAEDSDNQKAASATTGDFFKKITTSIIEIDNNKLEGVGILSKPLEQVLAEDYLTRSQEDRNNTVIIAHANEDRRNISDYIRAGLKEQGVIEKTGVRVSCLTSKRLTDAENKAVSSYSIGDVIRFSKQYYRVLEVDNRTESLLLSDEANKTKYFYPAKDVDKHRVELYSYGSQELAVGDKIRLTKTDKKRGLYANFEYTVKEIDQKQVVLDGDRRITLNHSKLKDAHWDYAYAVTGYGIQGGSKKYALDFEVSYRKPLANQRSFYIGISRAVEHLTIYTDNKERLLSKINSNPGDKYAALEVVEELSQTSEKNVTHDFSDRTKRDQKATNDKEEIFYDANEVTRHASSSAEILVERLLGKPNPKLSTASEWRYGNKGSLAVSMAGAKRGLWHNFETGEAGNLLTLTQKSIGLTFRETLKYLSEMFGTGFSAPQERAINSKQFQNASNESSNSSTTTKFSGNDKTKRYAQKLARESESIAGTIVEQYLTNRGIKDIDISDIRYHPRVYVGKGEKSEYLPAMLAIGRDKDGNIQAVQATYLDPKTAGKADIDVKKRTYGTLADTLVSLEKSGGVANTKNNENNENKISFIAEGVETGLSVKSALETLRENEGINSEVLVTLGKSNFTNIDPERIGDKVVFCLDNDGQKTFYDKTIHQAAKRLIDVGKEIFMAMPELPNNRYNKIDFNDIARGQGLDVVRTTINNSIPYHEWKATAAEITGKITDETLRLTEKIMGNNYEVNSSLRDLALKKPDLDLNLFAKLTNHEERSLVVKYMAISGKEDVSMNKQEYQEKSGLVVTKNEISTDDARNFLAKTDREIY